jgi:putative flippase GtrA
MRKLLPQLLRYGLVGGCSATVHFSIVIFLVEIYHFTPMSANCLAFFAGFQVSYWGHRSWTFAGTTSRHGVALPKLFVVASISLALNQGLFYFFLTIVELPYPVALLVVLTIVPFVTFVLSKFWVFRF